MRKLVLVMAIATAGNVCLAEGVWERNRFADAYTNMSSAELSQQMAQDVPTRRGFVAEALARHEEKAWPVLRAAMTNTDWRVRSCALSALEQTFPQARGREAQDRQAALLKSMPGLVDRVAKLLADRHYWVRCRAAGVLGNLGKPAAGAGTKLAELCADPEPWVRERATFALSSIPDIPDDVRIRGVVHTLNNTRTGFGDSRFAVGILRGIRDLEKAKNVSDLRDALIHFLQNPGEGMWSDNLSFAITTVMRLGPDRDRVISLFARVLTDNVYEQRGHPRVAVCKALPHLGDDARRLASALREAIEREEALIKKGKYSRDKSIIKTLEDALEALE